MLQNRGAIYVVNHCFYLDPVLVAYAFFPRYAFYATLENTTKIKGLGFFIKLLKAFPIARGNFKLFYKELEYLVSKKRSVVFYAEGSLYDYNQEVKPLMKGSFVFAKRLNVNIVPVSIVLKKRKLFGFDITKPFPSVTVCVNNPITPEEYRDLTVEELSEKTRQKLQDRIDYEGGDKTLYTGKIEHGVKHKD